MVESDYPLCNGNSAEQQVLPKSVEDMVKNFNVAFLLTSTLGLIFNTLSIFVLMVPKTISSFSFLLISLCVTDSVQLLFHWTFSGLSVFGVDFEDGWPRFHRVATFMAYAAFTCSIYIIIMVSYERYTSIKMSSQGEPPRPTRCGTAKSLVVLVTLSVLFDLPKMWELETCHVRGDDESINSTNSEGKLRLQFSELRNKTFYYDFYVIGANNLVHFVIPLISLVYLNVGIYQGLKEWQVKRNVLNLHHRQDGNTDDSSMTTMLFFIVGFFCICHIWYPMKFVSSVFHSVFWSRMYTFMYCVNNSINFLIYCVWGKTYRLQFKHVLKEIQEMREFLPKLGLWKNENSVRV